MRSVNLNDLLKAAKYIKITIPTEFELLDDFKLELVETVYKEAQLRVFYQEIRKGVYTEKPFPKEWLDLSNLSFEKKIASLEVFERELSSVKATALYIPRSLISYFKLSRKFKPVIDSTSFAFTKIGYVLNTDVFISPDENIYIENQEQLIVLTYPY